MHIKQGTVVSLKMQKTAVVSVDSYKVHPKYKKRFKVSKKFYAHDEKGVAVLGSTVTIRETRPLSKLKCWEIVA
jgi:small subunit ribosomal protein S17